MDTRIYLDDGRTGGFAIASEALCTTSSDVLQ